MKEEKKAARKKAAKKRSTVKLENILDLNANNIWNYDEFAIAEAWEKGRMDQNLGISEMKLLGTIRLAFELVHYNPEDEREAAKYENGGWAKMTHYREERGCIAIRKKAIERITDLSYENIKHISTALLLELISRNFGGGWDSIALSIRDIIETGFEISTTQLPASRIHAAGGTVEKKVAQGFDVLEIPKGTWVEAIFAKKKDPVEKIRMDILESEYDENGNPVPLPLPDDEFEGTEEIEEEEGNENDDTYFSSITPEADDDMKEYEEEGLTVEDISEGDV